MDIYELDSYRLSDAVKFHTELNPALWDGKNMRPEVRQALLKIADDFKTFMGIDDLALEDITVSGSNAAFSYTPHSDIDLHLLVDFSKLNPDEVYQELFNAKKYQYNDQHNIKVRGYDVELYVQDSNKPVRSLGEYSLVKDDWTRIPVQRRGNLDEKSTQAKYEKLKALVELATNSDDIEQVTAVTDTIKKYRQAGLDEHGEFGPENLAYKMLRTQGYIERLFQHKADLEDAKLSLDERKKKKKKKKKTFKYGAFGGMFFPGYHYYGQTDAESDGGGDGGGESVKESTVNIQKKQVPLDKVVRRFVHFAAKYLKLKQLPKIKLRKGELSHNIHSMGHYVDDDHIIEVETKDRHVMDILRTVAHELTHYRQHRRLGKDMPDTAGRTGSPYENEANAQAGIIMRHFQNQYPEFFASTVSEDGESVNAQYGDQTPPGPEFKPTMPAGTVRVDVSDVYDWYKLGQHISNLPGLGHHDFGKGPPSSIFSFGSEEEEHKYIDALKKTGLDTTDIDPVDPNQPPGMPRQKTDPTYNVDETIDTPVSKDEKANQDYYKFVRGKQQLGRPLTKAEMKFLSNYHLKQQLKKQLGEQDLEEGLGKALGTAAVAGAMALGSPAAKAQDTGRVAYQIGKQIYQPSGIFTRAGAEEEIKGMARDLARDVRTGGSTAKFLGRTILAKPVQGGERVAANGVGSTPEAAYQDALTRAYTDANRRYGPISVSDWRPVDNEKELEQTGGQYRAAVVIQGPAPVREDASGYIPTKKQARDPRYKTALTVDIKPGQLGKEANKLGLQTDSQGRPDLLMKNLANALKEYKETGIFETIKPVTPVPHSRAPKTEYPPMVKQKTALPQGKPRPRPDGTGKIIDFEIREDEDLLEVKMSPSALEAWANSPEAQGIRAGFEAEMIFRNTKRDDDEGEMEPDYDYDERPDDIDHVIDFFSNDDWGYGIGTRTARDLRESLWEEYNEWVDEQISESWNNEAEDQVKDYMETNVWGDDSERESRIRTKVEDMFPDDDADAIMAAGDAAPRFTKSSDQQAYVNENDRYAKYKEASDAAYEEFEQEAINEFESQGEYYDSAREYYWDMMREGGDYNERDFLRDRYGYMSEIANSQSLDWPYWTGGGSGGGERDWNDIADSLRRTVDMEVKVGSGYHSTTRKDNRWIIEPDGSLDPDDSDDMGLEIVSPPMPLPEALEKLKAVIEWGNNEADAYTNSSTGLHMGISIPYVGGDVDYVKLVLFMGDEYVLDKFGRASNTYAASAMGKLRQNMAGARNRGELTEAKLDPLGALELVQKNLIELAARYVQNGVGNSKYTSAHIKDGYIEFRSPGGDYLAMESRGEYDDIKNTMLRFARAMYIAGRPDLERKEYAKKLYKLISPGQQDDGLKLFSQFAAGVISPEQLKKQWADAVLQKEIPTTGKEEYEVYDMNNKNSPDGIVGTFYARDYDSAYDQFLRQYGRDINNLDVRIKQPWFDVKDSYGDIILTVRSSDYDRAKQKVQAEYGDRLSDDWEVFRRPDDTPEPEKKLSRRAQVAKRIKEPKPKAPGDDEASDWEAVYVPTGRVVDTLAYADAEQAVAWRKTVIKNHGFDNAGDIVVRRVGEKWNDNRQDSQQLQARIGEPRPAGAVGDTGYYRVTWTERRGQGDFFTDSLNIDAENANAAMDSVRRALEAQGREAIQIEANPQEPPAWRQRSQASGEPIPGSTMDLARQRAAQGSFTGSWQVRDSDTDEVLYTFSGVGNNQGDANRVAAQWLQQNAPRGSGMTDITVVPVMR